MGWHRRSNVASEMIQLHADSRTILWMSYILSHAIGNSLSYAADAINNIYQYHLILVKMRHKMFPRTSCKMLCFGVMNNHSDYNRLSRDQL